MAPTEGRVAMPERQWGRGCRCRWVDGHLLGQLRKVDLKTAKIASMKKGKKYSAPASSFIKLYVSTDNVSYCVKSNNVCQVGNPTISHFM